MTRLGPFTIGWRTDTGRLRSQNEDSLLVPVLDEQRSTRGYLFAVADGMGSYGGGRDASHAALTALYQHFYDEGVTAGPPDVALNNAIQYANLHVRRLSMEPNRDMRMGTTLVAALFVHDRVLVGHLGDSRAYIVRQGQIWPITQDHSHVQEQMKAGLLTPEQARTAQGKNVITRAVGHEQPANVDYTTVTNLQQGDSIVLCSDGLTNLVDDAEMARIVAALEPGHAVDQLTNMANERGGNDNITVQIIRIDWLPFLPIASPATAAAQLRAADVPSLSWRNALLLLGVILLLTVVFMAVYYAWS